MGNTGTESFDVRRTQVGHKRPDVASFDPSCFLHTATAIYALDEDGVCCYVTGQDGKDAGAAVRCVGAQYVACLDRHSDEGLVADPRVGAQALFVGRGSEMRAALLRTAPLTRVEIVGEDGTAHVAAMLEAPFAAPSQLFDPRTTRLGMPTVHLP
jgi:hypothetical protein